jgi:hypothetical protein
LARRAAHLHVRREAYTAGRSFCEGETPMKAHFAKMAKYNAWANGRLYAAASSLPDESYRKNVGAFFGSLHGTLNHLLVTDRIWMRRLTGVGENPEKLNAIMFDDLRSDRAVCRWLVRRGLRQGRELRDYEGCPSPQFHWGHTRPSLQPPDPSSRPGPHDSHGVGSYGTTAARPDGDVP